MSVLDFSPIKAFVAQATVGVSNQGQLGTDRAIVSGRWKLTDDSLDIVPATLSHALIRQQWAL